MWEWGIRYFCLTPATILFTITESFYDIVILFNLKSVHFQILQRCSRLAAIYRLVRHFCLWLIKLWIVSFCGKVQYIFLKMGTLFKLAENNLYFSVCFLLSEYFFSFIVVKNRFQVFSYATTNHFSLKGVVFSVNFKLWSSESSVLLV